MIYAVFPLFQAMNNSCMHLPSSHSSSTEVSYDSHSTGEEHKEHRGKIVGPRLQSYPMMGLGLEPGNLIPYSLN
jgi:hypothetical protein